MNYQDIELAFDFVSSGRPYEHSAYVSLDTGEIFWVSDLMDEEPPDDLETSGRYLEIPHKNDLDLGKRLVKKFVASKLPEYSEEVERIFSRPGAYSRFKDLLDSKQQLQAWYDYEQEQSQRALKEWCEENAVDLVENKDD